MRLPACLASCARLLYWIPVTIIGVVLLWSYYAYVVHFCWVMLPSATQRAAFLSLFHVSFGMLSWSFCKAVSTPPASPSVEFQLASSDLPLYEQEQEATEKIRILLHVSQRLPVCTRTASGAIRFCHQCQLIKPDRCHHCSVCQTCVLKMDHHCLWLNNCIGFSNYKFFVLFLLYTLLYCLLIIATVTPTSLSLWRGKQFDSGVKLHVLFLTLVSGVFGVTLCFLLLFHLWLLASNRTTLEWLSVPFFADGPGTESFDVGLTANVLQVLGQKKKLWLIPVFSSQGSGHWFPLRLRPPVPSASDVENAKALDVLISIAEAFRNSPERR